MSKKADTTILASDFVTTLIAGEALSANDAVYLEPTDGKAYKCDSDDENKINFFGFAVSAASSGGNVDVRHDGQIDGFVGLTIGALYYISSTAGAITATAPSTRIAVVGVAVTATVIKISMMRTVRRVIDYAASPYTWKKRPGLKYLDIELCADIVTGKQIGRAHV